MEEFNVAVLEDNKALLKDLIQKIKDTKLVTVISYATTSSELFNKIEKKKPDALILDIELNGDSMNGIDVANTLKIPVLFVSGKTRDFDSEIQDLEFNLDVPIRRISKSKLNNGLYKVLERLITDVNSVNSKNTPKYLDIKLKDEYPNIAIDSIVYISTSKNAGSESNNKQIFFTDREPGILIDFTFARRDDKGFSKEQFIQVQKSYCINKLFIPKSLKIPKEIEVKVFGKKEKIPISKEIQEVKKYYKK